jgi:glutamine synthetase
MCRAVEADTSPVRVDPRHALVNVSDRVKALGFEVLAAFEVEFYLVDPTRARGWLSAWPKSASASFSQSRSTCRAS